MGRPAGRTVTIGQKYGHLTPLEMLPPAGANGGFRYRCSCECGGETVVVKAFLFKSPYVSCKKCSPQRQAERRKRNSIKKYLGKRINGWDVLSVAEEKNHQTVYACRCVTCGSISEKLQSQINMSKSAKCAKCKSDYDFHIVGDVAIGTLKSGERFVIDAEDVQKVNGRYWHLDRSGYIISPRENGEQGHDRLHRVLAGVSDPDIIVDHINRDRTDCRKSNLRCATASHNAYNHSKFSTNASGYTGVYYSVHAKRYEAKIGYNDKRIYLGSSKSDLVLLAQMYNIAAMYLFGDYVGELNDVPEPSESLKRYVRGKCKHHIKSMNKKTAHPDGCAAAV